MRLYGLEFSCETIERIGQFIKQTPLISQRELSRQVCQWMGWHAANGKPKETVCRKALVVLNHRGVIDIGAGAVRQAVSGPSAKKVASSLVEPVAIVCELSQLGQVSLQVVTSRYSKAFELWKQLMDAYHYLGHGPLCGAQLRYLVHSSVYGFIGAVSFSSACWALAARDAHIGWTEAARRHNLQRLVCNSRFLILPHVRVPNLASHVLGLCAGRIGQDWGQRFGIEPVALETFVDGQRYLGTCYQAANWTQIGQTSGRRAADRAAGPKQIFFYPLVGNWRQILCTAPPRGLGQRPRPSDPADWVEDEFGTLEVYDPRLKRRLFSLVHDFYDQPQAPIAQACTTPAKTKAAYRLLHNRRIDMKQLLDAHVDSTVERIKACDVVLAVQDTTTLNYSTHLALQGVGPISNTKDKSVGLIVHDTMAFTEQGTPLGLLDVQCWARDFRDIGKKHRRKQLPIEEKESIKWLNSYRAVSEVQRLCPDTLIVSVADRESDIYEFFVEQAKTADGAHLLVRCDRARNRKAPQENLWQLMGNVPVAGTRVLSVPSKGCRPGRDATMQIRYAPVTLKPPQGSVHPTVDVWMVYSREVDCPATVKEPLEWMLLTTVAVDSFEQACQRLSWYARRWGIEVYHRTLKSGCRIEDRRLEDADSLQSCLAIDMVVAWRIYHLTKLGREKPDSPCSVFFEEPEWKSLYMFVHKTAHLPEKEPTLRQAMRMVAGLGGFLGRKGDGDPGPTTLWRGLQRLSDITAAMVILLSVLKAGP